MKYNSPYEGPWANPKKLRKLPTNTWRHSRPTPKTSRCRQCGLCYIFCPVGCIEDCGDHFEPKLDHCKGCGTCVNVCPNRAIKMKPER